MRLRELAAAIRDGALRSGDTALRSDDGAEQLRGQIEPLIVVDRFRCQALRPINLVEWAPDQHIRVQFLAADSVNEELQYSGIDGLIQAISSLNQDDLASKGSELQHAQLKIDGFHLTEDGFTTDVVFEASTSRSAQPKRQITARWKCQWSDEANANNPPRITSIRVEAYEEVTLSTASWFLDATQFVIGSTDCFQNEFRLGMDDWVNRLDRRLMVSRFGHHGVAIGDIDGDGTGRYLFVSAWWTSQPDARPRQRRRGCGSFIQVKNQHPGFNDIGTPC